MSKNHTDYNVYTPALISELKKLTAGVPRAEGVKRLMRRLKISDRNARRQYAKYVEGDVDELTKIAIKGYRGAVNSLERAVDLGEVLMDHIERRPQGAAPAGRPIKRLFYDIETSPNVVLAWKTGFKLTITPESILKERAIVCIAWKWQGEKETHVLHWDEGQDDKKMLEIFGKVVADADEICGHNLSRFDAPWIRTRCLLHGLPPIPDKKECDTLRWARSKFYFNSNKLDYIAKFLGLGGKIKTEFNLWKEVVLNKCPKAMVKMCDYCKYDVILLEKVWAKLSEIAPVKTHVGVLNGGAKWQCPRTGSANVSVSKTRVSAAGTLTYQFKNLDTGSYYTVSATAHEAYLEAKDKS